MIVRTITILLILFMVTAFKASAEQAVSVTGGGDGARH